MREDHERTVLAALKDAIEEIYVLFKAPKILDEMSNDAVRFVKVPAAGVRRNITVRN